jgi:molybdate transport system substrate-binding protein
LTTLLDANVKLGTSTPLNDPSGDYAWEVFRKADKLKPGAFSTLAKKHCNWSAAPPPRPHHLGAASMAC